jgi:hypothetical protein
MVRDRNARFGGGNMLAPTTLIYGCGTWAFREQYKYRITSAEMKFMRRSEKYTWQD